MSLVKWIGKWFKKSDVAYNNDLVEESNRNLRMYHIKFFVDDGEYKRNYKGFICSNGYSNVKDALTKAIGDNAWILSIGTPHPLLYTQRVSGKYYHGYIHGVEEEKWSWDRNEAIRKSKLPEYTLCNVTYSYESEGEKITVVKKMKVKHQKDIYNILRKEHDSEIELLVVDDTIEQK